jgi:hypothetical protein
MQIIVELDETEVIALSYVMDDPQVWVENAIKERARQAIDAIVSAETARMISDPSITEIPANSSDIVAAYSPDNE